jgi:hypothetical protein
LAPSVTIGSRRVGCRIGPSEGGCVSSLGPDRGAGTSSGRKADTGTCEGAVPAIKDLRNEGFSLLRGSYMSAAPHLISRIEMYESGRLHWRNSGHRYTQSHLGPRGASGSPPEEGSPPRTSAWARAQSPARLLRRDPLRPAQTLAPGWPAAPDRWTRTVPARPGVPTSGPRPAPGRALDENACLVTIMGDDFIGCAP